MSAKSELLAWVEARAMDADDVKAFSKLVAAYTAECVRADRVQRREAAQKSAREWSAMADAIMGRRPLG